MRTECWCGRPAAVLLYLSEQSGPVPEVRVEIVEVDGPTLGCSSPLHASTEANDVMRGKVMTFSFGRYGEFGMTFTRVDRLMHNAVVSNTKGDPGGYANTTRSPQPPPTPSHGGRANLSHRDNTGPRDRDIRQ
jgi:hypothetical protein